MSPTFISKYRYALVYETRCSEGEQHRRAYSNCCISVLNQKLYFLIDCTAVHLSFLRIKSGVQKGLMNKHTIIVSPFNGYTNMRG